MIRVIHNNIFSRDLPRYSAVRQRYVVVNYMFILSSIMLRGKAFQYKIKSIQGSLIRSSHRRPSQG